jgi:hypothetical protein
VPDSGPEIGAAQVAFFAASRTPDLRRKCSNRLNDIAVVKLFLLFGGPQQAGFDPWPETATLSKNGDVCEEPAHNAVWAVLLHFEQF